MVTAGLAAAGVAGACGTPAGGQVVPRASTVQAWRVGDERAETYLRLLAEAGLQRAGDQLRGLDATAGTGGWSDPGMEHAIAERALWKVIRAGRILVAASALDEECLDCVAADLHAAIKARSRLLLNWDRRRGVLHRSMFAPHGRPPPSPASRMMRVNHIGRALRVASGRAPSALHFMSLVRTEAEAVITVVMRMRWPPDGSSADLEITGAGPHHLPYDQFWAVDDQGRRYTVRFEGGLGGTAAWRGIARFSPVPPNGVRRLDLVGDGTRLIQLPLGRSAAHDQRAAQPATEPVAIPPGERLLVLEAERILASGDARGPVQETGPGEIITVLTDAGAIAADSPVPGQLAALCQRLGADGHGITVPAAQEIPAPWASVIAHRDTPVSAEGPEVFAPLASVLPDIDMARFALAGLSTAAGESHLHVISSGMPQLADQFADNWTLGFSSWLRDSAGTWHLATAAEPCTLGDGTQAFSLPLIPPLATVPAATEIVVTGPATQVRATVLVHPAPRTS